MSSPIDPSSSPADLRVGDVERERAAAALNVHVGAGRLDLAEFEQRVDAVYAARTRGDIGRALAGLPVAGRPAAVPPAVAQPGPALAARLAGHRLAPVLAPYVVTSVICLAVWLATSVGVGQLLYFWPMWVIGPWGAALALGSVTGRAGCAGRVGRRAT